MSTDATEPVETEESLLDQATRALTKWYEFHVVPGYAREVIRYATEERLESDEISDYLHEYLDGCQEAIYTFRAQLVVAVSSNSDVVLEQVGELEYSEKNTMFDSTRAFFALKADVIEEIERQGFNINDPEYDEESVGE